MRLIDFTNALLNDLLLKNWPWQSLCQKKYKEQRLRDNIGRNISFNDNYIINYVKVNKANPSSRQPQCQP